MGGSMMKKFLVWYLSVHLVFPGFFMVTAAHAQGGKVYTLAAMNMDAKGVSEVEVEVLSEKLRSHISQLVNSADYKAQSDKDQYLMVEQTQVDKILEQYEFQNTGCVSDSCALKFGELLQVDRIVIGQIGLVGNTYLVSARIVDVENRKAIAFTSREHRGSIDEIMSSVILEVGTELFMGTKKKSKKVWYIVGGALLVGAGAAASLSGGGGGEKPTVLLPKPPDRPQ